MLRGIPSQQDLVLPDCVRGSLTTDDMLAQLVSRADLTAYTSKFCRGFKQGDG